jgi:tetratricopeptide (TPR) repeat protein
VLSKAPEDRFQTAEAFTEALLSTPEAQGMAPRATPAAAHAETIPMAEVVQPAPEPTVSLRSKPKLPKSSRMKAIATVVALGAAVIAVLLLTSGPKDDTTAQSVEAPSAGQVAPKKPKEKAKRSEAKKPAGAADNAKAQVTTLPPQEEAVAPAPVETLADVRVLIEKGEREAAIAGLHELRRKYPKVAQYQLLLGNLYFEKEWWKDGMDHYLEALRLKPAFKKKPALLHNLITALSDNKSQQKAAFILQKKVGRAALPALKKAANRDESPTVRRRAAALVKRMTR